MRKRLRPLRFIFATAFRADPRRTALLCVLVPILGLSYAATGWWIKFVTDGVVSHRPREALLAVMALAASVSLAGIARLGLARMRIKLQEQTGLLLERRLVELAATIPGLEHHERPDYIDRLQHLRNERAMLGQAIGSVVMGSTVVVQVLGTVALLASIHPLLLLLLLLGLPSLWTSARAVTVMDNAKRATMARARLASEYVAMATSIGPAKEVRLFGLGKEILHRHRELGESVLQERARARLIGSVWEGAGSLVFMAGYIGAIAFVTSRVAHGQATPGDVLLTLTLGGQVNGSLAGVVQVAAAYKTMLLVAEHFLWFTDYAERVAPGRVAPPSSLRQGIALEHVSFRYPATEAEVLRDVNLALPAGTTVALVGDNGAGKSTFVKLLCGFYQPTGGRITVDGADLADIDIEQWRAGLSGAFQDFCRFEFIARETIGVGDTSVMDDPLLVDDAAERAGAAPVVASLPDGLATQLGRTFEGVDLSQGQWQKLALARSQMPRRPLLYVLDEPTASLDAASEYELYTQIIGAARQAASNGAITLLVSHRMSTVRAADLIVVLDGGRVVEVGTHAELMSAAQVYAELFALQSRAYQ